MENEIIDFEDYEIRRHYDEEHDIWYFSVIDIIRILIQQPDFLKARKYWNKLKERLKKEGSEVVTNCHRLKMLAQDGKRRLTYVGDTKMLFRLIHTIPEKMVSNLEIKLTQRR